MEGKHSFSVTQQDKLSEDHHLWLLDRDRGYAEKRTAWSSLSLPFSGWSAAPIDKVPQETQFLYLLMACGPNASLFYRCDTNMLPSLTKFHMTRPARNWQSNNDNDKIIQITWVNQDSMRKQSSYLFLFFLVVFDHFCYNQRKRQGDMLAPSVGQSWGQWLLHLHGLQGQKRYCSGKG